MSVRRAVIIGAGPAGLTAARELQLQSDIEPVVLEKSPYIGGIARTVNYKGNRIDIGGHRFFSKSDRVMQWWLDRLPMQHLDDGPIHLTYQSKTRAVQSPENAPRAEDTDRVMLVRRRLSRIYFLRKLFDYPITLSARTIRNLGVWRVIRIAASYARSRMTLFARTDNMEQFFVNRFGRELYETFFRSYTEKVWGTPCREISAEWGAQRIKGLSVSRAVAHGVKHMFGVRHRDIGQKSTETSLIEWFLYPKFGPGQMWELVAMEVRDHGGHIQTRVVADRLRFKDQRVTAVEAVDAATGERTVYPCDYVLSTMPVRDLVAALDTEVPQEVREVSNGLVYRDFITVGLLLNRLKLQDDGGHDQQLIRDNWIYIQEPDVLLGRLQIFNNWSQHMVADPNRVWVGLEYFCNETDDLWKLSDEEMKNLASEELARIDIIEPTDVLDATVIRMPKAYPAYFGSYGRFNILRRFLDEVPNLFLIGRNGMHRYNNQDHSMLTAMAAVENIVHGRQDKSNIWMVNADQDYHEEDQRQEK